MESPPISAGNKNPQLLNSPESSADIPSSNPSQTTPTRRKPRRESRTKTTPQEAHQSPETHKAPSSTSLNPPSNTNPSLLSPALSLLLYSSLWLFFFLYRPQILSSSVSLSKSLSQTRNPSNYPREEVTIWANLLYAYSWAFTNVAYKWYILVIGLFVVFLKDKVRGYKACFVFVVSYAVRQYLRLFIAETRPLFESDEIYTKYCSCSWGMPSGHSEGSAMVYSLLIYEFILRDIHTGPEGKKLVKNFTKASKITFIFVGFWIVFSVMFSRLYFGSHTYGQVLLGFTQALVAFSLMIFFERPLENYFLRFLNQGRKELLLMITGSGALTVLNLVLWFSVFDSSIKNHKIDVKACSKCFENEAKAIRTNLGRALPLPAVFLGLSVGTYLSNTKYSPPSPSVPPLATLPLSGIRTLFLKVVAVLLCYLPLPAIILLKSPAAAVSLSALVYTLIGLALSLGYVWGENRLKLEGWGIQAERFMPKDRPSKETKEEEMISQSKEEEFQGSICLDQAKLASDLANNSKKPSNDEQA